MSLTLFACSAISSLPLLTSLSFGLGEGFGLGAGFGGGVLLEVVAGDVLVADFFRVVFSGVTSTFGGLKENRT